MRWTVYAAYARATGAALVAVILAALLLMQASRNGSDLWLSFWVSHEREQVLLPGAAGRAACPSFDTVPCHGSGSDPEPEPPALGACVSAGTCGREGAAVAWWAASARFGAWLWTGLDKPMPIARSEAGLADKLGPAESRLAAAVAAGTLAGGGRRGLAGGRQTLVGLQAWGLLPGVRFYLSVLLLFAAANSLFTLVRPLP